MGISVADALFSRTQQRVLAVLFGQPDRSFYATEVIALARVGTGSAHRELSRLEAAGLVLTWSVGNQKHFQVNRDAPVFTALHTLVMRTVGAAGVVGEALKPLEGRITVAFIYGSVAKAQAHAASDVDLMVISDHLSYAELMGALQAPQATLGAPVNPTLYTEEELALRHAEGRAFVTRVLAQPKLFVKGNEDDLQRLLRHSRAAEP